MEKDQAAAKAEVKLLDRTDSTSIEPTSHRHMMRPKRMRKIGNQHGKTMKNTNSITMRTIMKSSMMSTKKSTMSKICSCVFWIMMMRTNMPWQHCRRRAWLSLHGVRVVARKVEKARVRAKENQTYRLKNADDDSKISKHERTARPVEKKGTGQEIRSVKEKADLRTKVRQAVVKAKVKHRRANLRSTYP